MKNHTLQWLMPYPLFEKDPSLALVMVLISYLFAIVTVMQLIIVFVLWIPLTPIGYRFAIFSVVFYVITHYWAIKPLVGKHNT